MNLSLTSRVLEYFLGRTPNLNEAILLDEMMTMVIDHGPDSPSAAATLATAKEGKDLVRAVEAGVAQIGPAHGGAIEPLMKILVEDTRLASEIVSDYLSSDKRMPGFGHRIYKDEDPRATKLMARSKELGFEVDYVNKLKQLEAELEKQKGKKLPINIDGAMAAVLCDLGVDPKLGNAFFLWPRVAGLVYQFKQVKQ